MEFEEVLKNRISTRKYTEEMPSDADIRKILDAGLLSPIVALHKVHLTVVTNKEAMEKAEAAAEEMFGTTMPKPYLYGAPVWIVFSGKLYQPGDAFGKLNIDTLDNDTARTLNQNLFWMTGSVIENMELAATALGLGSCGINTTVVSIRGRDEIKKAVGIPEDYEPLASLIVGYPAVPIRPRKVREGLIPISFTH